MKRLISYLKEHVWLSGLAFAATPTPLIPGTGGRITQLTPCSTNTAAGEDVVNCSLNNLLTRGETIFFSLVGGLAVILLIWAGIQYIQSMGNPDAVKAARQRIVNILIAVILLVAAYFVLNLIVIGASWLAGKIG
jgi:hypothetical protein